MKGIVPKKEYRSDLIVDCNGKIDANLQFGVYFEFFNIAQITEYLPDILS